MAVIGKIYRKTCRPTRCIGTCIQWREAGSTLETDGCITRTSARRREKNALWTTPVIIDSQAVQNTGNAGVGSKGFCFYKATNGIKRHLAVDTLGKPFFTHCTKANVSDDAGLVEMLRHNIEYFRFLPMNIPKITILLDHGYHPEHLTQERLAGISRHHAEN